MNGRSLFRVAAAALALSTLSFAAGIAGDLSDQPEHNGTRVVVSIPPPLAVGPARAAPPRATPAPRRARAPRIEREEIVEAVYFPPPLLIEAELEAPAPEVPALEAPLVKPVGAPLASPFKPKPAPAKR